MLEDTLKHSQITELILKAFYGVYGELGYGFSEKVYENSMAVACRQLGLTVVQQAPIKVYFQGFLVGEYLTDLLVNELVIVELKAMKTPAEEHEAQLLNYLKATPYEVGQIGRASCRERV